jgi:hypothetical protein
MDNHTPNSSKTLKFIFKDYSVDMEIDEYEE